MYAIALDLDRRFSTTITWFYRFLAKHTFLFLHTSQENALFLGWRRVPLELAMAHAVHSLLGDIYVLLDPRDARQLM